MTKAEHIMQKLAYSDPSQLTATGGAGNQTPSSIAQTAKSNNKPIATPKVQPVGNTEVKQQQPQAALPAPPEGNSQGQKIAPQQPKGKYMNKAAAEGRLTAVKKILRDGGHINKAK